MSKYSNMMIVNTNFKRRASEKEMSTYPDNARVMSNQGEGGRTDIAKLGYVTTFISIVFLTILLYPMVLNSIYDNISPWTTPFWQIF